LVGFFANHWIEIHRRSDRVTACWRTLEAEFNICSKFAETFLTAGIISPSYRLPFSLSERAIQILLENGAISGDEAAPLIEFISQVQTFNRGLDAINQTVWNQSLQQKTDAEYSRACLKAQQLQKPPSGSNLYSKAIAILLASTADS
jgi:hypothetical protein